MPGNPRLAYIELGIAGKSLEIPPNNIIDFSYTEKNANGGNKFSMTLFDSTGTLIADLLSQNIKESQPPAKGKAKEKTTQVSTIDFRWGYDGEMSKFRFMQITAMRPGTINRAGVTFQIEGNDLGTGTPLGLTRKTRTFKNVLRLSATESKNIGISDIVQSIAEVNKWTFDIDPTKIILEARGRSKVLEPQVYVQSNKTDLQFINELAVQARSFDNDEKGRYQVYFEDTNRIPKIHFHPHRAPEKKPIRVYRVQVSRLGEVREYEPEIQDAALITSGASVLEAVYRDPITRLCTVKSTGVKSRTNTDPTLTAFKGAPAEDAYATIAPDKKTRIILPSDSDEGVEAYLKNLHQLAAEQVVSAKLTVNGDVTLVPSRYVTVIVLDNKGRFFFTSRKYRIMEVEHSISGGDYRTTLVLNSSSSPFGDVKHDQTVAENAGKKEEFRGRKNGAPVRR